MPSAIMFAIVVSAALAGCATANSAVYSAINPAPHAFVRRDPAAVDMFVGKTPARPYVEVGLFEIYAGSDDNGQVRSTEELLGSLRLHAALRGCDAVQVLGVELAGKYYHRVMRGVCAMYTDAQAQEAASLIAVYKPLAGEGKACTQQSEYGGGINMPEPVDCTDPLVCANKVCASPYR